MILLIKKLAGGSAQLFGAGPGRELMNRLVGLVSDIPEASSPQAVLLDLSGIDASASFLREAFFGLREWVRLERPDLYPVLANASASTLEDIAIVADVRGPILTCTLDRRGNPDSLKVIGRLDPKARVTFEMISELGETDVRELIRRDDEGETKPTAWSNRLAGLVRLGLVMEIPMGRSKRYRPVAMEI